MDKEQLQRVVVNAVTDTIDNIDDLQTFILAEVRENRELAFSCGGNICDMLSLIKAIIDKVSEDLEVEDYSRFALELTIYIRRLMEQRYHSDSELKEK